MGSILIVSLSTASKNVPSVTAICRCKHLRLKTSKHSLRHNSNTIPRLFRLHTKRSETGAMILSANSSISEHRLVSKIYPRLAHQDEPKKQVRTRREFFCFIHRRHRRRRRRRLHCPSASAAEPPFRMGNFAKEPDQDL